MYTYVYIYIWRYLISCFDESPPNKICTPTLVLTSFEYMYAPSNIHWAQKRAKRATSSGARNLATELSQYRQKPSHNTD